MPRENVIYHNCNALAVPRWRIELFRGTITSISISLFLGKVLGWAWNIFTFFIRVIAFSIEKAKGWVCKNRLAYHRYLTPSPN